MTPFLLVLALASWRNTATIPVPRPDAWWMNRYRAMATAAQAGDAKIVFIGDSITHAYGGPPKTGEGFLNRGADTWDLYYGADHALNLGISGDQTQHVLWRLQNGDLGKCRPRVAVVMIGTNNAGSNTAPEIAEGVEAVCDEVHTLSPATKVLLLAVFPRATPDSPLRTKLTETNRELAAWAPDHNVQFLDIGRAFLAPDGTIPTEVMPDLLHPSALGYRKWAMAMEPTLARMMGRPPKTTADPTNTALVPVTQDRDHASYDWMTRFKATRDWAQHHVCRLAFIGDSINHHFGGPPIDRGLTQVDPVWQKYYGKRDAVDLGFGWDRTENVLWRLEQGQLDGMPLEAVSLMIGTNNLSVNTPQEIAAGVTAIVDTIRRQKPRAQILLLAIFPRGERPDDPMRLKAAEVNRLIEPLGQLRNVTWMDIGPRFLKADGTISRDVMPDFLHPSEKGYEIWANAVEPWMRLHVRTNAP